MIIGTDKNQRIEFIASSDTTEPKTIFVLRPLTASEILDFLVDKSKNEKERVFTLIEMSVVEIKNYDDSKTIKEVIESLPIGVVNELSLKIAEIHGIKDAPSYSSSSEGIRVDGIRVEGGGGLN